MEKKKGTTKNSSAVMDAVVGELAELLMSAMPDLAAPQLKAIYKLGDAQFVCTQWLKPDLRREILARRSKNQIDLLLQKQFCKTESDKFEDYVLGCRIHERMTKYREILNECMFAYKSGLYDLTVVGLCSVINGLLSELSMDNSTDCIISHLKVVRERLESGEIGSENKNKIVPVFFLLITVSRTIESFDDRLEISDKESTYLNRHQIMQGRSTREKTDLDCLKMAQLLYGLLVLSRYIPDDKFTPGKIPYTPPELHPFSPEDLFTGLGKND